VSWDAGALRSRISDATRRRRYEAASPNETELSAYAVALPGADAGVAVVLGMTPELRALALQRYESIITLDSSAGAIALYRHWVPAAERARERITEARWEEMGRHVRGQVDVVVGDGVFGNLGDAHEYANHLRAIRSILRPGGRLVTRHAVVPRAFDARTHEHSVLLGRYRSGELDPAEFGLGSRLLGHHACCYDPGTGRLDNPKLFSEVDDAHGRGELTTSERAVLRRYYFGGSNCILGQDTWEALLRETGFSVKITALHGRAWYGYYPVYACEAAGGPESPDAVDRPHGPAVMHAMPMRAKYQALLPRRS
jgi:SAM-dependent methyltransferase